MIPIEQREVYYSKEAAAKLGISPRCLTDFIRDEVFTPMPPYFKGPGKTSTYLFPKRRFDEWLDQHLGSRVEDISAKVRRNLRRNAA